MLELYNHYYLLQQFSAMIFLQSNLTQLTSYDKNPPHTTFGEDFFTYINLENTENLFIFASRNE